MGKPLHFIKRAATRSLQLFLTIVLMVAFAGISPKANAQIYFLTNDANSNGTSSNEGVFRVNNDGSGFTALASGFAGSPTLLKVDAPNNRGFEYEAFSSSPPNGLSIRVFNLSSGATLANIPITLTGRVQSLRYDPIGDYIYYVVQDAAPTTSSANDALVRVKPDGTGSVVLASGFCSNPSFLALDIPNNRVFVYQNLFSNHSFVTLSLSGNSASVTQTAPTPTVPAPMVGVDCDYDSVTDYIYMLTSDNTPSTPNVNDALYKIRPDGSNYQVIKSAIASGPQYALALDAGNNKAYIYDAATNVRTIYSVDLSSGATTPFYSINSMPAGVLVTGIYASARAILTTSSIADFTATSATMGGNITRSESTVSSRGVVYSSSNQTPTIGGTGVTQAANGSGTGSFSASVGSLSPATTYYVRAYATSSAGTSYGTVTSFTTKSNDANLSNLAINSGTLSPSFGSGTTSYTASVANSASVIEITPTVNSAYASVRVNNNPVSSGSAFPVALNVGDNTISSVVTAQDGTTKTYTVTVTRAASSDANLSAITVNNATLNPAFDTNTTSYTVSVPNSQSGLSISATVRQPNATLTISGAPATSGQNYSYNLYVGTTNINYVVTAQDGVTKKTYSIVATRAKADQTITLASTDSKTYGDADYSAGATASSNLIVSYSSSNTNVATIVNNNVHIVGAGTTTITASQGGNANYNAATSVTQTLTVGKRAITIKPNLAFKVYGNGEPAYSYSLTGSGLATGDGMTGSFTRVSGEAVGTYALSLGTKHPVNAGSQVDMSDNYDITFISNDLTITARPVTITATSGQGKIYGDADPALVYSVTSGNTVNGDALSGSLERATGSSVGTYSITQGSLTNTNNPNYNITFNSATFTVSPASLTVTADNKTKDYSAPIPTLTYQISGFTNGDTQASLTSPVVISTTAVASSAAGDYPITVSGAANANYTVAFVNGTLTVNAPSADATLSNLTTSIGTLDPLFNPNTEDYEVSVPDGTTEIGVTPTVNNAYASVDVNYTTTTSGSSSTQYISPGDNLMPIVVTAQNGSTKMYNLNVKVPLDKNAKLLGLAFYDSNTDYYTPEGYTFDQDVHSYTINVPNSISSLRFVPFARSNSSTITINGTTYDGFYAPGLKPGTNVFTIVVTAQNTNYTETYTVTINRALSSNNNLFALQLGGVALNPTFSQATTEYTANVLAAQDSVNISASLADTTARVKISGSDYDRYLNKTVALRGGDNTLAVDVKAANGDIKTYTVVVNRPASTNALLSNMVLNSGALTPAFSSNVFSYTQSVAATQSTITIKPTLPDGKGTVTVNGTAVASGQSSAPVRLVLGTTAINVKVTSEDGYHENTYVLNITRPVSHVGTLATVTTNPAVTLTIRENSDTLTLYKGTIASTATTVKLKPSLTDINSKVTVNGVLVNNKEFSAAIPLVLGVNVIDMKVTAEDGVTSRNYKVSLNRGASKVVSLTMVRSPNVGLTVDTNTDSLATYTGSVVASVSSFKIKPVLSDKRGTVTVNGTAVVSGQFSDQIVLNKGLNTVNVVVTAEDGETKKTYQLNITRQASTVVGLTIVRDPHIGLVADSNTPTLATYHSTIHSTMSSITLKPVLVDTNATVTVNGVPTANNTYSAPIRLMQGVNTVDIVVTAEDRVTQKTYRLNITKPVSKVVALTIARDPNIGLSLQSNTATLAVYNGSVVTGTSSIRIKPTLSDVNASVTINGAAATNDDFSSPIALTVGANVIEVNVTAEDGLTQKMYRLNITRPASKVVTLAIARDPNIGFALESNSTSLAVYRATATAGTSSIRIKPTLTDANGSVTINGATAVNDSFSSPIALSPGVNTIDIVVTAEDGVTTKTYRVNVTRQAGSSNADLASVEISQVVYDQNTGMPIYIGTPVKLTETSPGQLYGTIYASSFPFEVAFKATAANSMTTVEDMGGYNTNGSYSSVTQIYPYPYTLNPFVYVIAEDGVTARFYTLNVTVARQPQALMANKDAIKMVSKNTNSFVATDDVVVHQGVSPNGDGVNDYLVIEGLSNTTGNKLSVMNAAGNLVFETKDYGKDGSNLFTGRSRGGDMLRAGTYYYSLEYQVGKETKRKTGYLILKY